MDEKGRLLIFKKKINIFDYMLAVIILYLFSGIPGCIANIPKESVETIVKKARIEERVRLEKSLSEHYGAQVSGKVKELEAKYEGFKEGFIRANGLKIMKGTND